MEGAWLFGSVALGGANGESDIDLLIVARDLQAPDLDANVAQLRADVRSWVGNDLQLVEHTTESWHKLLRSQIRLVELRVDGIALAGDTALLLERRR